MTRGDQQRRESSLTKCFSNSLERMCAVLVVIDKV